MTGFFPAVTRRVSYAIIALVVGTFGYAWTARYVKLHPSAAFAYSLVGIAFFFVMLIPAIALAVWLGTELGKK